MNKITKLVLFNSLFDLVCYKKNEIIAMRGDFQAGKKYLSDRGWTETGIYILHQIPI